MKGLEMIKVGYMDSNSFVKDFEEGCRLTKLHAKIFYGNNEPIYHYNERIASYNEFFAIFSELFRQKCFAGCIQHLNKNLTYQVNAIMSLWHSSMFPSGDSLFFVNKYFNISSFYASIYREADYDFFVSFDKYLKVFNSAHSRFFRNIKFTDVFDKRFFLSYDAHLTYAHINPQYNSKIRGEFNSTDGLKLLASMSSKEGENIFSYLLCEYRFELHDIFDILEKLILDNNLSYVLALLGNYNFYDSNNDCNFLHRKMSINEYVKKNVSQMVSHSNLLVSYETDCIKAVKDFFTL
jgi:hypothetical protein